MDVFIPILLSLSLVPQINLFLHFAPRFDSRTIITLQTFERNRPLLTDRYLSAMMTVFSLEISEGTV